MPPARRHDGRQHTSPGSPAQVRPRQPRRGCGRARGLPTTPAGARCRALATFFTAQSKGKSPQDSTMVSWVTPVVRMQRPCVFVRLTPLCVFFHVRMQSDEGRAAWDAPDRVATVLAALAAHPNPAVRCVCWASRGIPPPPSPRHALVHHCTTPVCVCVRTCSHNVCACACACTQAHAWV